MATTAEWVTELGAEATRAELQALYGGGRQRGIEASTTTPNIVMFTDLLRGNRHGYNYDGWGTENSVYYYTGEGQVGDQTLTAGNKAVLQHRRTGRAIRLFGATGEVVRGGKLHTYLGQFVVDDALPQVDAFAQGADGADRSLVVFRLRAASDALYWPGRKATVSDSVTVPLQRALSEGYPTKNGWAQLRESALVQRHDHYLRSIGHRLIRWRIHLFDQPGRLYTDTYDVDARELYEAKGTIERDAVRMAVGQLFDYRRRVNVPPDTLALTVLLPERPSNDLLDFMASVHIGCVYATGDYTFERHSP